MSLTTDKNDPRLLKREDGKQNEVYLVLSEEERAKGFIRPVRQKYIHRGKQVKARGEVKLLTEEERRKHPGYVAIDWFDVNGMRAGSYITKKELDAIISGEVIGGCGVETVMNITIAETYARNPKFYSATWCMGCNKHLPVGEFVWSNTDEIVGS